MGLATEATRAVADHGFVARGMTGMRASYQLGNTASRKILLGLGFRETGEATSFCRATNGETRIMNLVLTREDWAAARERRP